jgi:hypothetical protein
MQNRIRWTHEERVKIAKEAYRIREQDALASDITCVRMAMQAVLPVERHRNLIQMQNADFIYPAWEAIKKQEQSQEIKEFVAARMESQARSVPQVQRTPLVAPPSAYPQVIQGAKCKDDFSKTEATKAQPLSLDSLTTDTLAQELIRRLLSSTSEETIRKIVREEVNATLERRLPGILPPEEQEVHGKHNPEPQIDERPKLPKVCILGLMNGQTRLIKDEYPHLDFHFLEGNEGHAKIKNTMNLMDLSIRTVWCKGQIPQGLKYQHAKGLDTLRTILNRFPK